MIQYLDYHYNCSMLLFYIIICVSIDHAMFNGRIGDLTLLPPPFRVRDSHTDNLGFQISQASGPTHKASQGESIEGAAEPMRLGWLLCVGDVDVRRLWVVFVRLLAILPNQACKIE